jgi:hypothetical protein
LIGILLTRKAIYEATPIYELRDIEYCVHEVPVTLMVWRTLNEGMVIGEAVEAMISKLHPAAVVERHQKLSSVSPAWGSIRGVIR